MGEEKKKALHIFPMPDSNASIMQKMTWPTQYSCILLIVGMDLNTFSITTVIKPVVLIFQEIKKSKYYSLFVILRMLNML